MLLSPITITTIFPEIIAQNIVNIQSMTNPTNFKVLRKVKYNIVTKENKFIVEKHITYSDLYVVGTKETFEFETYEKAEEFVVMEKLCQ